jgi:hypothetical protein
VNFFAALLGNKAAIVASLFAIGVCVEAFLLEESESEGRRSNEVFRSVEMQLNAKVSSLETKVSDLEGEIAKRDDRIRVLSETDQNYWARAVEIDGDARPLDAMTSFTQLAQRFPSSPLAIEARKRTSAIERREKSKLEATMNAVASESAEKAIETLSDYVSGQHLQEYMDKAGKELERQKHRPPPVHVSGIVMSADNTGLLFYPNHNSIAAIASVSAYPVPKESAYFARLLEGQSVSLTCDRGDVLRVNPDDPLYQFYGCVHDEDSR